MRASSKTARLQAASRAEASPHIRRATSFYQRGQRTRPRPAAQRAATVADRNPLIPLLRAISLAGGRKQPGRRYGPAPKKQPGASAQGPAPMSDARRLDVYEALLKPGQHYYTARQHRQLDRMSEREWRRGAVSTRA